MSVISVAHHLWESEERQLQTASLSSATNSPWVFYTHISKKRGRLWEQFHNGNDYPMSQDSAMKQITGYHARDSGCDSRSRHTRVIPGSFQLDVLLKLRTSMLTRHCISKNTSYNSQNPLTNTLLTTVLRSCYILISSRWHSLSVSIKNCHAASEYYGC